MTFDDIEKRLKQLESEPDPEFIDVLESSLYREFILYVSTLESPQDAELSRKALMVLSAEETQF